MKHHPHPAAQSIDVHTAVDILPIQAHRSLDPAPLHQVVHPVQGFQQGGLATARGANEGRNLLLRDPEADLLQRLEVPVKQVQFLNLQLGPPYGTVVGGLFRIHHVPSFPRVSRLATRADSPLIPMTKPSSTTAVARAWFTYRPSVIRLYMWTDSVRVD